MPYLQLLLWCGSNLTAVMGCPWRQAVHRAQLSFNSFCFLFWEQQRETKEEKKTKTKARWATTASHNLVNKQRDRGYIYVRTLRSTLTESLPFTSQHCMTHHFKMSLVRSMNKYLVPGSSGLFWELNAKPEYTHSSEYQYKYTVYQCNFQLHFKSSVHLVQKK